MKKVELELFLHSLRFIDSNDNNYHYQLDEKNKETFCILLKGGNEITFNASDLNIKIINKNIYFEGYDSYLDYFNPSHPKRMLTKKEGFLSIKDIEFLLKTSKCSDKEGV